MNESILTEATRLESERNFEAAIALLNEVVRQDPTFVEAYIHLAADSGILGRFRHAELYARNALALDATSGQAKYYLACALRDRGWLDDAYREMEQALILTAREAAKGTIVEALGLELPVGWSMNVAQAARDLQRTMLFRNLGIYREKRDKPFFTSISSGLKTYRNERHGFEIDMPDDWSLATGHTPWRMVLFGLINGVRPPHVDLEFSCGPNEQLNFVIQPMRPELPLDVTERLFTLQAQDMGFVNWEFGRISIGGKEHTWVRYESMHKVWSKKYMIVLGGDGYAFTATCGDQQIFARKEKVWDAIASSFRLLPPVDN